MDFVWDDAKHERNLRERGFGFDFAAGIFEGDTVDVRCAMSDAKERTQWLGSRRMTFGRAGR